MKHDEPSGRGAGAWGVLSTLAILCVPALLWFDAPVWELPLELLPQALMMPLAFAVALWAAEAVGGGPIRRIAVGALGLAAGLAVAWGAHLLREDVAMSRGILGIGWALGVALLAGGVLLRGRLRTAGLGLLGIAALGLTGLGGRDAWRAWTAPPPDRTEIRLTAYYPVSLTRQEDVVAPADRLRGGGLARLGDAFLGMTGTGALYRVWWDGATGTVSGRRLEIPPAHDRAAFDAAAPAAVNREWFRTLDVAVAPREDGWDVFVSHHHWDDVGQCVRVRLSVLRLDHELAASGGWSPVFETRPCLPLGGDVRGVPFVGLESGGRLAWRDSTHLVLTVGDHQFDGWNRDVAAAQRDDYDYGKTFLVDVSVRTAEEFTRGHRNPQGLYVTPEGLVWETEHGPEGGDELNLLRRGGNYGWPWATYGTDYQRLVWPPAAEEHERGAFVPPVFAWTPSIATSNLIRIEGDRFPRWRGDLIVSTLAGRSLFRVVLDGTRVVLVEPIPVGSPVRDLLEGPDGRLWLWGDYGEVTVVDVAEARTRGEAVFATCGGCHSTNPRSGGLGPSLQSVIGRPVAAKGDFDYSPALRELGGRWTRERLDAFLADPGAFAPGTSMTLRLDDPEDRAAVIDYLQTLPP